MFIDNNIKSEHIKYVEKVKNQIKQKIKKLFFNREGFFIF